MPCTRAQNSRSLRSTHNPWPEAARIYSFRCRRAFAGEPSTTRATRSHFHAKDHPSRSGRGGTRSRSRRHPATAAIRLAAVVHWASAPPAGRSARGRPGPQRLRAVALWPDAVGPHHLVVLVFEDVAVPDEQSGAVEQRLHARDLVWVGDDGVLATGLPALRWARGSVPDRLAADDLKGHLVYVDRVGVGGEVVDLPDLDGSHGRVLRERLAPAERVSAAVRVERSQVRLGRCERLAVRAVQDDVAVLVGAHPYRGGLLLVERDLARVGRGAEWRDGRQRELARRGAGVDAGGGADTEAHYLPGRVGVGRLEVDAGDPAAEGFVRSDVLEDHLAARRDVREVDDHVGALGRAEQQLRQLDGRGQEAALVADLPQRQPVGQAQNQEARVAAVQKAQAVAALLHVERGPGGAVDDDRVAKKLRVPDRRDVARAAAGRIGHERDLQLGRVEALEEGAVVGVEQRAVLGEGAVLDRDRDLEVVQARRVAERRRRTREGALHGVTGAAAQQVEPGRPGVDVGARHAESVVVVPQRPRALVVVVLEDRATGRPRLMKLPLSLGLELAVERASPGVPGRDVPRPG